MAEQQINEAVARVLDWKHQRAIALHTPGMGKLPAIPEHWELPDGTTRGAFDCEDPRDWRPLLEEMLTTDDVTLLKVDGIYACGAYPEGKRLPVTGQAPTLGQAVCLAYLAWKGVEV